jgi:AcrR family transcriptional regulator
VGTAPQHFIKNLPLPPLVLSQKHLEIQSRDNAILDAAREIFFERGYYGLTMDGIANRLDCPKGTIYHRFSCKEDIIICLATRSLQVRNSMMYRAAAFEGRSRERILAVGEAIGLFTRLYQSDSRLLHTAMGPLREKASPERVLALSREENAAIQTVHGILVSGAKDGDLPLEGEVSVEEIALGAWGLVDGAFTLIESGIPFHCLELRDPFHKVWHFFNIAADGYGWKPLLNEWDYEETLVRLRKQVFPDEAQQVYGEGQWYGDRL